MFNGSVVLGSARLSGPSYCHSPSGREQLWRESPARALRLVPLRWRLVQHPDSGEQLSRHPAAVRGLDVAEQQLQRQQQQHQRRRRQRRIQHLPASTCRPAAAPVPWTLLWCGLLWDGKCLFTFWTQKRTKCHSTLTAFLKSLQFSLLRELKCRRDDTRHHLQGLFVHSAWYYIIPWLLQHNFN